MMENPTASNNNQTALSERSDDSPSGHDANRKISRREFFIASISAIIAFCSAFIASIALCSPEIKIVTNPYPKANPPEIYTEIPIEVIDDCWWSKIIHKGRRVTLVIDNPPDSATFAFEKDIINVGDKTILKVKPKTEEEFSFTVKANTPGYSPATIIITLYHDNNAVSEKGRKSKEATRIKTTSMPVPPPVSDEPTPAIAPLPTAALVSKAGLDVIPSPTTAPAPVSDTEITPTVTLVSEAELDVTPSPTTAPALVSDAEITPTVTFVSEAGLDVTPSPTTAPAPVSDAEITPTVTLAPTLNPNMESTVTHCDDEIRNKIIEALKAQASYMQNPSNKNKESLKKTWDKAWTNAKNNADILINDKDIMGGSIQVVDPHIDQFNCSEIAKTDYWLVVTTDERWTYKLGCHGVSISKTEQYNELYVFYREQSNSNWELRVNLIGQKNHIDYDADQSWKCHE